MSSEWLVPIDVQNIVYCRSGGGPGDTVIFFTLRNYEIKDEKYYFIIFTIAIYERNYIIIGRALAIVQCLLSRTKYIIIFIFIWNERY
jgi:signal peptidase I